MVAWPGVLTVLSVLAVVLGTPPPAHDAQPRTVALATAPSLPELRAAPQLPLPSPLPSPPPGEAWSAAAQLAPPAPRPVYWNVPALQTGLTWWGRRQTDGG
ncbi:hypothetical protein [Deinococcus sp.]|uniref:hypothetical protein n=1 Tax=Deinococcus sp. TaxID=47478 RepID=UPI0025C4039E|nr:hypothetical protein [Deinococcus sp.]